MKQILYAGVVAVLAVVLAMPAVCPAACEEMAIEQITDNDTNDINIKVSGKFAVWIGQDDDANGGDSEIYFFDGNSITKLTDNTTDDVNPRILGGSVVWQGKDGDWEIFYYDGTCVRQITNNDLDDVSPRLTGTRIMWQGKDSSGDWEIFTSSIPMPLRMRISPQTINLKSKGKSITVRLILGSDLDAADVVVSSLRLAGQIPATMVRISTGSNILMAKFSRPEIQALLEPGNNVEITLTGQFTDGSTFTATDTVKVINPGHSQTFSSGATVTSVSFGSFDGAVISTIP